MLRLLRHTLQCLREGVVDFEAQRFLQSLLLQLTLLGGVTGFLIGYLTESFYNSFLCVAVTAVISAFACIPSWPACKRNPVHWVQHDPQRVADLYAAELAGSALPQGAAAKPKAPQASPKSGSSSKKKGAIEMKKK